MEANSFIPKFEVTFNEPFKYTIDLSNPNNKYVDFKIVPVKMEPLLSTNITKTIAARLSDGSFSGIDNDVILNKNLMNKKIKDVKSLVIGIIPDKIRPRLLFS